MKDGSREALVFFGFLSIVFLVALAAFGIPAIALCAGFGSFILPFLSGVAFAFLLTSLMFTVVALYEISDNESNKVGPNS